MQTWPPADDARLIEMIDDHLDPAIWPEFLPGRTMRELLERRRYLIQNGYVDSPKPL